MRGLDEHIIKREKREKISPNKKNLGRYDTKGT